MLIVKFIVRGLKGRTDHIFCHINTSTCIRKLVFVTGLHSHNHVEVCLLYEFKYILFHAIYVA